MGPVMNNNYISTRPHWKHHEPHASYRDSADKKEKKKIEILSQVNAYATYNAGCYHNSSNKQLVLTQRANSLNSSLLLNVRIINKKTKKKLKKKKPTQHSQDLYCRWEHLAIGGFFQAASWQHSTNISSRKLFLPESFFCKTEYFIQRHKVESERCGRITDNFMRHNYA